MSAHYQAASILYIKKVGLLFCFLMVSILFPLMASADPISGVESLQNETLLNTPLSGQATSQPGQAIPWSGLGAKATEQAGGKGLSIAATDAGAKIECLLQRLEGDVTADGLFVTSTAKDEPGGRFMVKAAGFSRNGARVMDFSDKGEVTVDSGKAIFSRPGVMEEYSSSADGIRQDFIIPARPEGSGVLSLRLSLSGATAAPSADGVALTLKDSGRKLVYNRLYVTDASGKALSAEFRVRETGGSGIDIDVDDTGAVYPVRIDPTITDADWVSMNSEIPGTNGTVFAVAIQPGVVYIGGSFTLVKNISANRIAKWDGSNWSALGTGMNNIVRALALDGSGNLYAGGNFTLAGGVANTRRIARWDGSNWSALGTGMNNNYVYALTFDASGTNLYAGGSFGSAGGVASTSRIARWNGSAWSALGTGMNSTVYALSLGAPGTLYAGGLFTIAGGVPANYIASWNGTTWGALGTGMGGTTPTVWALAFASGNLYAGGAFTSAGSVATNRIARWDGSTWYTVGTGTELNNIVYALALDTSGNLYVGGSFTNASSPAGDRIVMWNGTTWSALGTGMNSTVYALKFNATGTLYVGGAFTTAGGTSAPYIARWTGAAWNTVDGIGTTELNNIVYALAQDASGNLYVGGSFLRAGGVADTSRIARWDGSAWSALGTGMNNTVRALALFGTNLYAGGAFTLAGGVANTIRVARCSNPATAPSWNALGTGIVGGTNPTVYALALDATGITLYAGGQFTTSGGVATTRIARCSNPATAPSWSALGTGMDGIIYALALDATGATLYAGGRFRTADGVATSRIARCSNPATAPSWSALGTGMSGTATPSVYALAFDASGDLYAGGSFTTSDGVTTNRIAKWTVSTSTWSAVGTGMNNIVYALGFDTSGTLYAGGQFTLSGGVTTNRVAQWNGTAWNHLGLSGASNIVYALKITSANTLYAGGSFLTVGGIISPYIAQCLIPYTVTFQTDGTTGASISGTTPQYIHHGNNCTAVTANAPVSHTFTKWTKGGVDYSFVNPLTVLNVTENMTLTAVYTIKTFTLTYTAVADGSVSGTSPQTVNYGANGTSVTAVPDPGYHFTQWSDGSTAKTRTDTNVTADISVTAQFALGTVFTLTYTAGANGSIVGSTPQTVNAGDDGSPVEALPDSSFHFDQWSDGSKANPRTDTNVSADISVTASFAAGAGYTLTYTADPNGSISGTSPQTVTHGGDGTAVTPVPNTGYHFTQWSDGSTANPRTDTNVKTDITVTAQFALNTYTLTYTAGAHGSITGISPQTVSHGGSGTAVTAVADAGYYFTEWSDGVLTAIRQDINVTGNISVTAQFALSPIIENNRAFLFNGVDDSVYVEFAPTLDLDTMVTLEAWVWQNSTQTGPISIVQKNDAFRLYLENGNEPTFSIVDETGETIYTVTSGTPLSKGKWYHLAGTFDNNTLKIYINGYEAGTESPGAVGIQYSDNGNLNDTGIGANESSGAGYFDGLIDDVRIWNTARTQNHIRDYMCKKIIPSSPDPELVCYLRFDEDNPLICGDTSGNGNVGIIYNADRVCSSAPIGDASAHDYTGVTYSDFFVDLAYGALDHMTITGDGGTWDSAQKSCVHVYRLDAVPTATTAPFLWKSFDSSFRYWGVFVAGGINPTYQMVYHYDGYPGIISESDLKMAYRHGSCDQWLSLNAELDTNAGVKTFTKAGLYGTEFILGSPADPRNAIVYNGSTQYVEVANESSFDLGDTGTVEAWVYPTAFTTDAGIVFKGTGEVSYGFGLAGAAAGVFNTGANNRIGFVLGQTPTGATRYLLVGNQPLTAGIWYHIACVWNRDPGTSTGTMTIYINGVQDATQTIPMAAAINTNADALRLGMQAITPAYFQGRIDEVRVWNTARTQIHVRNNMCKKISTKDPNLVGYWRFDEETTGTQSYDFGTVPNNIATMYSFGTVGDVITARVCSSAPIGNTSNYNYFDGGPGTVSGQLTHHTDPDYLFATENGGIWNAQFSGIQIYEVDGPPVYPPHIKGPLPYDTYTTPNGLTPPYPPNAAVYWSSVDYYRYWGIFVTDWINNPFYQVVYHYTGNPSVPAADESILGLAKRNNYCNPLWADSTATLDAVINHTLTKSGETGTEYVLGGKEKPLAIVLASFTAGVDESGDCIQINWETATEIDTAGFYLWRSDRKDGVYTRIEGSFTRSEALTETMGATYAYTDCDADLTVGGYYYKLEEIDFDDTRDNPLYGPIGPVSQTVSAAQTIGGADSKACFIGVMSGE